MTNKNRGGKMEFFELCAWEIFVCLRSENKPPKGMGGGVASPPSRSPPHPPPPISPPDKKFLGDR